MQKGAASFFDLVEHCLSFFLFPSNNIFPIDLYVCRPIGRHLRRPDDIRRKLSLSLKRAKTVRCFRLFFISLGRIFVRAFCLQRRVAVSYQRSVGSIYLFTTLPGWALGQTGGKERDAGPGQSRVR